MSEWVKFHKELTKGAKRAIPREARFVFMELSLHARARRGVIDLRPDGDIVDAIHAELGGGTRERKEVARAWPWISESIAGGAPLCRVEEGAGVRKLIIDSWEAWNRIDESADRAQRYREKRKNKGGVGTVTRDDRDARDDTRHALRDGHAARGEEKREDKRRGEESARAPRKANPAPADHEVSQLLADNEALLTPADPLVVAGGVLELARMSKRSIPEAVEATTLALEGLARKYSSTGVDDPSSYLLGIVAMLMGPGGLEGARAKRQPRGGDQDARTFRQRDEDERSERNARSLAIPGERR